MAQTVITQDNGCRLPAAMGAVANPSGTDLNPNQATASPTSWFTVSNSLPTSITPHRHLREFLPQRDFVHRWCGHDRVEPEPVVQNACSGAMPDITVTAA